MVNILNNIVSVFFPELCLACKQRLNGPLKTICAKCRHELPLTKHHLYQENPVKRIFHGRTNVQNATALLLFQKKGIVQQLIHHLKYKGHQEIGAFFGDWMGIELANTPEFNEIDLVVPVPLHKTRLRKRGYNQVTEFAKSLSEALKVPLNETDFTRRVPTSKSVFKKRMDRWKNLQDAFEIGPNHLLANKHILLVDDVVTTGATLEACANVLLKIPGTRISIATLAITE